MQSKTLVLVLWFALCGCSGLDGDGGVDAAGRIAAINPSVDAEIVPVPTNVVTTVVPVVPPFIDFARVTFYATIVGLGSAQKPLYVPLQFPVGSVVRDIRLRVQDAGGSSQMRATLLSMTDNAQNFAILSNSPPSSGSGIEETIAFADPDRTLAPRTQYAITAYNINGQFGATSRVYRLEVDLVRTSADQ